MVAPINHEGKIFIHASQFSWGKLEAKKDFFFFLVEGSDQNIMVANLISFFFFFFFFFFSKKEGLGAGEQKPRLAGLFQLLK